MNQPGKLWTWMLFHSLVPLTLNANHEPWRQEKCDTGKSMLLSWLQELSDHPWEAREEKAQDGNLPCHRHVICRSGWLMESGRNQIEPVTDPSPTIESIMRPSPLTTSPLETLAAAQALMARESLHQLPVVENGALIGILSERDLHAHSGYLERTKVDAAMTSAVVTVAAQETAQTAARLLIEHEINALPVVQDGRLVGIVSRTDLLTLLVRIFERS